MSKVFYDRLIILDELEREVNRTALSPSEKEELWQMIDEIIHHRVLGCVMDNLPSHHHHDFLTRFHDAPHNDALFVYLTEKTGKDAVKLLKGEIAAVADELLGEFRGKRQRPKRFLTSKKRSKQNPQKKPGRQNK